MAFLRQIGPFALSLLLASSASAQHQIVCSGKAAGGYAAFPDVCRLPSGELFCVFYSGYGHVSTPNAQWPKGGRILAVRSSDNGRSWSKPVVVIDTERDDRDPSVACLKDGTLLLNWFTLHKNRVAIWLARSTDQGKTWSKPVKLDLHSPYSFACSAPVRLLPDGSLILGLYCEDEKAKRTFGATVKSYDGGKTWKDLAYIGEKAGIYLDAETDVVRLKDGKLLAALRSSKVDMH
jgi:Neuraminidase (sialidase)